MPRFRCVTMEVCGSKYILCDDKDSVTLLDSKSMQKVKSFPLDDGQYLYAAYYHEQKNIIYASFDNCSYWIIDLERMIVSSKGTLPRACLKFVVFDAKYLLCACEQSSIIFFNTDTNKVS
jgi:hypothetical protein